MHALAEKLGITGYNDKTEAEWQKVIIDGTDIPDKEEFKKRGIYHIRHDVPYVAFRKQIGHPEHNPFPTPSGKIEIYSNVMAEWNSKKLPPIPKWIEPRDFPLRTQGEKYPLRMITPHGKRRANAQFDNLPWLQELMPQTVWINPADAEIRNIEDGDMVRVFNERGTLLLPAKVTQRIMHGVVQVEAGAWFNPDENGVDLGGNSNILTNDEPAKGGHFVYNNIPVDVKRNSVS